MSISLAWIAFYSLIHSLDLLSLHWDLDWGHVRRLTNCEVLILQKVVTPTISFLLLSCHHQLSILREGGQRQLSLLTFTPPPKKKWQAALYWKAVWWEHNYPIILSSRFSLFKSLQTMAHRPRHGDSNHSNVSSVVVLYLSALIPAIWDGHVMDSVMLRCLAAKINRHQYDTICGY